MQWKFSEGGDESAAGSCLPSLETPNLWRHWKWSEPMELATAHQGLRSSGVRSSPPRTT